MRFGKHAPKLDYRTLRFPHYADAIPAPPEQYDSISRVIASMHIVGTFQSGINQLYPIDGNDKEGCCTIAGAAHAETNYHGLVGNKSVASAATVHKIYRHLSGGEDTGLNMLDVLNYWRKTGITEKILAFAKLNPHNHVHVKQAIQLFGGVYMGFQCQEDVIADFDAGKPWTPGKLTQDGHAVFATGYDADTISVLTWGAVQKGTWAWVDETCDEAYVILPQEAKKPGFAPGFNFAQLQTDLAAVV